MYCLLYRFRKKQYHKQRSPVAQNASMVSTRQFHIQKKTINSTAHIMLMMLRINIAAQNFSNLSCSLTYMIYEHRQWTCSLHTLNHFSSPTHPQMGSVQILQILITLKLQCMTYKKKHSFL